MNATAKAKKQAAKAVGPHRANPSWGRALVTKSQFINWKRTDAAKAGPGPVTLSAGPVVIWLRKNGSIGQPGIRRREVGDSRNRVTVALGECAGGPGEGQDLDLRIEFPCPMRGTQVADGPITIEQALSFEEAVRAVFQSARELGLLPIPARKARR
jgi:hypothetical protein